MATTKRDYYEVLGVPRDASTEEIEKAFLKLARQYHPDRNIGNPEAAARFREINEAHDVLSDQAKRERYDRYGHAGLDPAAEPTFASPGTFADLVNDLFDSFMGGSGGRRGYRSPQPGADLRTAVDITLA
ncbi:MAG: DnaJ domain-containing protein, partial [Geminicoccaceae bacterium]|nr:DnaJ domain-containing protein [Geminicoccaceae bacterium]